MRALIITSVAALALGACSTAGKVVAAPFKVAGKTAEVAGKSVYYTGKGVVKTGEVVGKGVYYTGKGAYKTAEFAGKTVYYVGATPVIVLNGALDTTQKTLDIAETSLDVAGKAITIYRKIPGNDLDAYFDAVERAGNIVEVVIG